MKAEPKLQTVPAGTVETVGGAYHRFESDFQARRQAPATTAPPGKTRKSARTKRKRASEGEKEV